MLRSKGLGICCACSAAVANNNKADLFISLHGNATVRPVVAGAEVFYLNLEGYGEHGQLTETFDAERTDEAHGVRGDRDVGLVRPQRHRHRVHLLHETRAAARVAAVTGALSSALERLGPALPTGLLDNGPLQQQLQRLFEQPGRSAHLQSGR